ncbi:MAG: glutathione S-transferase family protein [Pseudomonadota bacterium]
MFPGTYTLYGTKRSYFTAKLENALRFQALPYVLVDKMIHDGSEIERRTGSGAIPALVTPEDWPLSDSTPIARLLNDRYPERAFIPATPVQQIGVRLLEDWLDEWFMRVAMYTRWNFPESVDALVGSGISMRELGKPWHATTDAERATLRPQVDFSLQRIRTFRERMTTEVARAYGTTPEQGQDVMRWYGEFLDDLADHLAVHPFLLGTRPTVADFVISGGCAAHFGNDLYPRALIEARAPVVLRYAERCWDATWEHGEWLADDALPDTWQPLFAAMQTHYLRYLLANREAIYAGTDAVEVDFGVGMVATPPRAYQELSRLDIRDELLRLAPGDRAKVDAAIPAGVLDAYLAPPLGELPELRGNKDTFPDPRGIGTLDDVEAPPG